MMVLLIAVLSISSCMTIGLDVELGRLSARVVS